MTSRLPRNGIWGRETTSMAPEAGPIPDWKKPSGYSRPSPRATTFTENAKSTKLNLDPADIAQDVALVVENVTSEHQTFMAALIGTGGEPCEVCGGFGRSPFRS